jgi:hypothetical protein
MLKPLSLHEDRLFPAEPSVRAIARRLYQPVAGLPAERPERAGADVSFERRLECRLVAPSGTGQA